MHDTKALLITRNGLRCMLCGKQFPYRQLQWHHIIPKYVAKRDGGKPDDSYENGALLCLTCHMVVHDYTYWDKEYEELMKIIRSNKKPR